MTTSPIVALGTPTQYQRGQFTFWSEFGQKWSETVSLLIEKIAPSQYYLTVNSERPPWYRRDINLLIHSKWRGCIIVDKNVVKFLKIL